MADSFFLETARGFRSRILVQRDDIEAARRLPAGLAQELAQAGFFRLSLPAAYGGLDLAPTEALAVFEELARADASVAWCATNSSRPDLARASPIRRCCPNRAIGFHRFPASSPASARWRSASPAPPSTPSSRSPSRRRRSARARSSARTTARKPGCLK